jgi:hypothetical protein
MGDSTYVAPKVAELGSFRAVTNGVWFGAWRDVFGGKAFIKVDLGWRRRRWGRGRSGGPCPTACASGRRGGSSRPGPSLPECLAENPVRVPGDSPRCFRRPVPVRRPHYF